MKINIDAEPKEIAALVSELQERQESKIDVNEFMKKLRSYTSRLIKGQERS